MNAKYLIWGPIICYFLEGRKKEKGGVETFGSLYFNIQTPEKSRPCWHENISMGVYI